MDLRVKIQFIFKNPRISTSKGTLQSLLRAGIGPTCGILMPPTPFTAAWAQVRGHKEVTPPKSHSRTTAQTWAHQTAWVGSDVTRGPPRATSSPRGEKNTTPGFYNNKHVWVTYGTVSIPEKGHSLPSRRKAGSTCEAWAQSACVHTHRDTQCMWVWHQGYPGTHYT